MDSVGQARGPWPQRAAIFGASGGIGGALCAILQERHIDRLYAGSRSGKATSQSAAARNFAFDLEDEASIIAAAELMCDAPPELVIVATGALTLPDGTGPERSFKRVDPVAMEKILRLNTIGPALIAKHILPLFPRSRRSVFAVLSARVGSISDNRIGGWHSYRASKAALNMLVRNWSIELARTHPEVVIASLHPGTVDTALSQPFQSNLPEGQLTSPQDAARNLLSVIERLKPADSGYQFDWKGERLPD